ncbi:hypothetical protein RYX36_032499 [Vicia faba]
MRMVMGIIKLIHRQNVSGLPAGTQYAYRHNEKIEEEEPNMVMDHTKCSVAVVLSPIIDAFLIHVEAIVQTNPRSNINNAFVVQEYRDESTATKIATKTTGGEKLDQIFKLICENLASKNQTNEPLNPPSNIIKSDLLQQQKESLV